MTEAQIETWSHQGAMMTSRTTYKAISSALKDPDATFARRGFEVYLQGSYGNDTNIWRESDVDIVLELTQTFSSNKASLPADQFAAHERDHENATYLLKTFRKEVYEHLASWFGVENVADGRRSIKVKGSNGRRDADVVVCQSYRHYRYYKSLHSYSCEYGMEIKNRGEAVVNYPKLHSDALTKKHQATSCRFKPVVRVLKNIKNKMEEAGVLDEKDTCSYFLECWLCNAPDSCFVFNLKNRVERVCNWLLSTNAMQFVMPHGVFSLIGDSCSQWELSKYQKFCRELPDFYNNF